ncbi:carbon-phosphorus lyase complex accessory protein [Rubinisphaera italica]|uniref:Carbon-phosphorus lyase complex accessory protein n=1 Tax=Rubinisphaera italica TaxID=2527969 RepID=A0A5C5XCK4_9PLAN|nr:carbon-phosphorus lyase complex accessory protein [Rubinisphaera italica]
MSVKVRIINSSLGPDECIQFAQTILINDEIAIDAGTLGLITPLRTQQDIEHVFLSHSHLDHVATLPLFLDNVYKPSDDCPTVYGTSETLASLHTDFFNDRVWPDLFRLSEEETPFLRQQKLSSQEPIKIENLSITPVLLNHVVPTMGFIIQEATTTLAIISDTLPTVQVWKLLNEVQNLSALFLECSFPNRMQWLADKAGHLTPQRFQSELAKLNHFNIPVYAIHVKATYHEEVIRELQELKIRELHISPPNLEITI